MPLNISLWDKEEEFINMDAGERVAERNKKVGGMQPGAKKSSVPENQLDSLISFLQLPKLQKNTFLFVSYQTTDNCEQT